jgi:hypothetical protein
MHMSFPHEKGLYAAADASWGDRNLMGILLMLNGASVLDLCKKFELVDSSTEAEGIASARAAEIVAFAREIMRALGVPCGAPTSLYTDNVSSMRIADSIKSTSRAQHALRRYHVLQQRVARGEVLVRWVPDKGNPADYLTKWIPGSKLEESVAHASGRKAHETSMALCGHRMGSRFAMLSAVAG